jgi:hypothetical protein
VDRPEDAPAPAVAPDAAPGPGTPRRPPLRARLAAEAPMLLVLGIAAVGLVRVATAHWREGATLLGGCLLVAAVLRAVLPADRAGLVAIRSSKVIDVLSYTGLGLAVVLLAVTITRGSLTVG